LTLADHLRKLFTIILEEYPIQYNEIVKLSGAKKARIIDDNEAIIIGFKNKKIKITNDIPEAKIPTGYYSKESIIALLDDQLCLNDAVKLGLIDCTGKLSEILKFWDVLQIIIYVSSRSIRAYRLWSEYKEG
jgi:uncharacterized protein YbjT (DUF2867 family)